MLTQSQSGGGGNFNIYNPNIASKRYLDSENTLTIPDRTRVDLGARYLLPVSDHSVTLRARIINLLDENYWETSSLNQGESRTFIMSVSLAF